MNNFSLKNLSAAEREQLLRLAQAAKLKRQTHDTAVIPCVPRTGSLPQSFAQQRLWFLGQFSGISEAYHIPGGLRLRGRLDRDALCRALDRIVARHEALRTTFAVEDGQPIQRIASPDCGFALRMEDLRGSTEEALQQLAAVEAETSFDLTAGPLVRGRLVQLGDEDHAMLVTMHHIVSDGWSMGVFIDELSQLYSAFSRGEADPLPALTIQYADYAVWQRHWLQGEVQQRQADYWQQTLRGAPALLALPSDYPRPAEQRYTGATQDVRLDRALTDRLKALSQRCQTTLYMTLLAGWAVLLARLSGQDEVVIGSPVANRGRAELEPLIGFFVNTLALRIDTSGAPSVADLLARVKHQVLGAQHHQDLPFEQVVELLQPPRSLAHAPLFQVMLTWQNTPEGQLTLPGLQVEAISAPQVTAQFDLSLTLQETDDGIVGGLDYATALFHEATISRYLNYWYQLLDAMSRDDLITIDRLPLQSDTARAHEVAEWNQTQRAYPQGQCVHELIEAQAAATPAAVAVRYRGQSLTYGELNAAANRLAHQLRAQGVGPGQRVAVCSERHFELVIGLLAVWKAGGAYVPLDPNYPAERLHYLLTDSAPVVLLADAVGLAALTGTTVPVLDLQATADWADQPADNLPVAPLGLTAAQPAYVIYTSGSTGQPKGVVVPHRSLVNHLYWQSDRFAFGAADRILQRTSIAFDASVWELWTPLAIGARLVLLPDAAGKDPAAIAALMVAEQINIVQFVPSLLEVMLPAADEPLPFRCRYLFCGGEPLSPSLLARVQPLVTEAVVNLYGPTETTIDASSWRCEAGEAGPIPIGRPIANTQIHLLDRHGQPVPSGVVGELYIGGAGVALGYLNQPALTAARFVADPFSAEPTARLYRTGDLGRRRRDGAIEYLGRNDHQLKLRGFRIELGEIEAQLLNHPSVREAVVVAKEGTAGPRLIGYWLPAADTALTDAQALRQYLASRLPDYMVPAALVSLTAWPLLPNGKLDRRALPEPVDDRSFDYVPPENAFEAQLAMIWEEALRLPQVGVESNFFALGGNSIRAMLLISRCNQAGLPITIRDIYVAQTIRQLVQLLMSDGRLQQESVPMASLEAI
ncbi:non-ribosomal peptide synthetase [Chitinivorax sp. B]|uniref:non-ribosomal peptide synthetase n=1 Tax=Chitinivorax sp. B TaxID=2502235 RepID=UPI0010F83C6D|nr:non-ribosomal peptide synthetase [Chitinivorax sp. B]